MMAEHATWSQDGLGEHEHALQPSLMQQQTNNENRNTLMFWPS